jgi:hypothetical protein
VFVFAFSAPLFGQGKEVALTLVSKNGTERMYVRSDIERLYFGKPSYLQSVNGLKDLKNLTTIIFERTAFVNDFSFLQDAKNLRNLFLVSVHIKDWAFLEHLPYLEKLYIIACSRINTEIDFDRNIRLEYIEIRSCGLVAFPELYNLPLSLKYLNLSWNNIRVIPDWYKRQNYFLIFLYQNNVDYFQDKFIIFDEPADVLPDKFVVNIG